MVEPNLVAQRLPKGSAKLEKRLEAVEEKVIVPPKPA